MTDVTDYGPLSFKQKLAYEALAFVLRVYPQPRHQDRVKSDVAKVLEPLRVELPPKFAEVRRFAISKAVLRFDAFGRWSAGEGVHGVGTALLQAVSAGLVRVP